jgi:hypothetical protein
MSCHNLSQPFPVYIGEESEGTSQKIASWERACDVVPVVTGGLSGMFVTDHQGLCSPPPNAALSLPRTREVRLTQAGRPVTGERP